MGTDDRAELTEIMRRIAEGDHAAVITLYHDYGDPIRAAVARQARRFGATHFTAEDLENLALDFCLALVDRAGSWDPNGGALPWVWAERVVMGVVRDHLGQYGVPFEEGLHGRRAEDGGPAFAVADHDEDEALDLLAQANPLCALLREALAREASPRDRKVFLDHAVQQAGGDPSPATTVARLHGVTPANVRKIVQRVRQRLVRLARAEARFTPLLGLPILFPLPRAA